MTRAAETKVLHIVNGEFYAGAERVQDLLAMQLPEFGYEAAFVCLKDGIFDTKRQAREVVLHNMPMQSRMDIGLARRLATLIKSQSYALVHTHTPRAALVGQLAALMSHVPMVHHVHSPSDQDTESGWRNTRNSLIERLSLMHASILIPVSASLEQYLLDKGYNHRRIRPVFNGVPVIDTMRKAWQPGDELVIGSVALYRPRKGIEVLLQAIAEMRNAGHAARLHAVGPFETAEYEQDVRALAENLGLTPYITWTGFTSDVTAEFAHMHVFALPSLFGEGMPMVVLEAMAAGLPVVSTRVEGIPQVVREEQDGFLAEPGNAKDLSAVLTKITANPDTIATMGESGQARQRESFSDVAMAKGVAEVYEQVLAL